MAEEEKQGLLGGGGSRGSLPQDESRGSVDWDDDTPTAGSPTARRRTFSTCMMAAFVLGLVALLATQFHSSVAPLSPSERPKPADFLAHATQPPATTLGATLPPIAEPPTAPPIVPTAPVTTVPPTEPPTPPPTAAAPAASEGDFGTLMKCAGKESGHLTLKQRLGVCAKTSVVNGFSYLGHHWAGYSTPNQVAEEDSFNIARPLYSVPMAKALTSMSQISQCGPENYVKDWTCPMCKEAGFELVKGSHRFIQYQELGRANATFILVARVKGQIPHAVTPRPAQQVQHEGEDCWAHCGGAAGYCAWCGVGNACCKGAGTDPLECKGVQTGWSFHTCVAARVDRTPGPVVNTGKDCYDACGKAGGFCNFCGPGNACCKAGVEDARECRVTQGFTTDHYECVAANMDLEIPPANLTQDFGCAVVVRGSHNKQNGMSDVEFNTMPLPYSDCEGCRVHVGFNTVWQNAHANVVQALGTLGCLPGSKMSRILLTGESFGAGVATIAQYYLQATGYTMELQYNFGSPRVGNVQFAENFNEYFGRQVPMFRVTHAHDVVSRLPPAHFLNYRHVNSEVFYPAEDPESYVVCLGGEDYACQNRYDIAMCLSTNVEIYDSGGSLKSTPGEAFDADHCHSGLAPDQDMCQCTLSDWWKWYQGSGLLEHRWDSAPKNGDAPRLAPGTHIG